MSEKLRPRPTSRNMALLPKGYNEIMKQRAKAKAKLNKISKWRGAKGYKCRTLLESLFN